MATAHRLAFKGLQIALPSNALKVLGLSGRASLEDARRAHRALAFQLHPDLVDSRFEAEESLRRRTEQLVIANAAREAIEVAVRHGTEKQWSKDQWTNEARREWDESTKATGKGHTIHLSAMLGRWDEVLDSLSFGVDPNVATPAQGAPPIFYAACCDIFGKADLGRGDEGRLRVIEVLASNPGTNLSMKGKAMWAEGHTIHDLVSKGRCGVAALDILTRSQDAMASVLSQGRMHQEGEGALRFAE